MSGEDGQRIMFLISQQPNGSPVCKMGYTNCDTATLAINLAVVANASLAVIAKQTDLSDNVTEAVRRILEHSPQLQRPDRSTEPPV